MYICLYHCLRELFLVAPCWGRGSCSGRQAESHYQAIKAPAIFSGINSNFIVDKSCLISFANHISSGSLKESRIQKDLAMKFKHPTCLKG